MIQKLLVLFLGILLFGCTQNQRFESSKSATAPLESTQISFEVYAGNIAPVALPLIIPCEKEWPVTDVAISEKLIARFGTEGAKIYGKLADTETFTAIIYLVPADIMLPVIQTTDKEGNKISDLPLFEKWCGEDEFSTGTSKAEITEDLTIILSDSVVLYSRNDAGEIIEESKKTEVRRRTFTINESGRINEKH